MISHPQDRCLTCPRTGDKVPIPQPIQHRLEERDKHCQAGASVWKFASTEEGINPDVTLVGIGSEVTFEVIVAASILRRLAPYLRVRVVNVTDLMILESETLHPHSLTDDEFSALFTPDRPIHFNYHGYKNEIRGLLFGRNNLDRVTIECYREEGSTTTPFDMMLRNYVSRYHVCEAAIKGAANHNPKVAVEMIGLLSEVKHQAKKVNDYIMETGKDPEGTYDTPKFEGTVFAQKAEGEGKTGGKEDGFFVN